jgi:fumarate reductase flavoprotein subunit
MHGETEAAEVLIVGAGACGLVAALALHDAGIEAVLLERDPLPQGSTALSSGFIPAAGTRAQREAGIADGPEAFAADIQAKAKSQAAAHLVDAYTGAAGTAVDRLEGWIGQRFELLDGFLYPGHRVRRMHSLPARTGAALIGALTAAAEARGIPILTNARVTALEADANQRVQGLRAERPDGREEHLACRRAVLLACNGYGGNPTLVESLLPEMRDAVFAGHSGNDGSALGFGAALGAATADLSGYQGHGSWAVPHGALITWAPMTQGAVQVNARGERFHDETRGYSEAAAQVLAQPGGVAWNLFDTRLLTLARGFPDFAQAEGAGAVRQADDVPALAALIAGNAAVDPDRHGVAERLRSTLAAAGLEPPWFAIRVTGALFHTQGGLDVDADCRVLRARDRTPLPNLWAAGGAARGVSGPGAAGYLSGNGLLSAVAGGFIAAQRIAAQQVNTP